MHLGVIAMKGYSIHHRSPELEPYHQRQFSVIPITHPFFCRYYPSAVDTVIVFYAPPTGLKTCQTISLTQPHWLIRYKKGVWIQSYTSPRLVALLKLTSRVYLTILAIYIREPSGHPQLRSPTYIYTGDLSKGWPEGSLFNSYYTGE